MNMTQQCLSFVIKPAWIWSLGQQVKQQQQQNPACIVPVEKAEQKTARNTSYYEEVNTCCSKLLGFSKQQFSGCGRTLSCSFRHKCWRKRLFLQSREMLCLRGRGVIPTPPPQPNTALERLLTLNVTVHSQLEPFPVLN